MSDDEHNDTPISNVVEYKATNPVFRCTKGHEFTDPFENRALVFWPSRRQFCVRCVEELLIRAECGEFK